MSCKVELEFEWFHNKETFTKFFFDSLSCTVLYDILLSELLEDIIILVDGLPLSLFDGTISSESLVDKKLVIVRKSDQKLFMTKTFGPEIGAEYN